MFFFFTVPLTPFVVICLALFVIWPRGPRGVALGWAVAFAALCGVAAILVACIPEGGDVRWDSAIIPCLRQDGCYLR